MVKAPADDGKGQVIFATLGVVDKDGDLTEPGAFGRQTAHLLPMHVWNDADTPFIGVANIREANARAIADIELNMDLQRGRDWRSSLKFALDHGKTIEWSYGFDIIDSEMRTVDGEQIRVLKKLKVHEVSPVVIGAGVGTRTVSVKECESCGRNQSSEPDPTLEGQFGKVTGQVAVLLMRCKEAAKYLSKSDRMLSRAHRDRLGALRKSFDEVEKFVLGESHVELEQLHAEVLKNRVRLDRHLRGESHG